jgi:hypothetical protein
MRTRQEMRERRRKCLGRGGITAARNPSRREGESGALKLELAPAREGNAMDRKRGSGRGQFG